MTIRGGPSAGPRSPTRPKKRQTRDAIIAPSRISSRSGGRRSSEIFTTHQAPKRLRQPHPTVRLLVVLEQRHEDSRARQSGVVERVDEAHLALGIPPPEVRPPRLPVVKGRAAVSLAIFA